jgi:RHS repeat-associated protein
MGGMRAGGLTTSMSMGYTDKPYDAITGLYSYGYRDYQPQVARFTTVDPIRDGSNWFAYVNNDPVNWIDPWGLTASDRSQTVRVITAGIELNVVTLPTTLTGELITFTYGFFDAAFYIDGATTADFTAHCY